ncbi:MAG: branched-chain amino acid ABC transporter permease [Deltaproteobacteria bacterium]|nr:branched-chain amino acid ABC transporter permease [Deltaproteobacteria bacterium]
MRKKFASKTWLSTVALWGSAALLVALLPIAFRSGFMLTLLSEIGIMVIFALSYNMLLGQTGLLSFGHAVYFGLGGFITMHALNFVNDGVLPLPLELLPVVGGLGGLIFGIVFGYVSTRRAGTPFALISLGIGELIAASSLMLPSFFGGEQGISGDRMAEITLTPFGFGQKIEVYYLIAFWMLASAGLMYLLTQTPLGRVANAVRDNPERASFVGYNAHIVRTIQCSLAAFFAGIAGGLFAISYEIVTSEIVGAIPSGNVLMMTYIGGTGFFFGPILGAILITLMELMLAHVTHAWVLYYGLMFIAMILWVPGGMASLIMMHKPLIKGRVMGGVLKAYAVMAGPVIILFMGCMSLIEILYHLSLSIKPEDPMSLFGIEFYVQSLAPWVISLALTIGGFLLFLKNRQVVSRAWQSAANQIKQKESAS